MKIKILKEIIQEAKPVDYNPLDYKKQKEVERRRNEIQGWAKWNDFVNSDEYEDAYAKWRKEAKKNGNPNVTEDDFQMDDMLEIVYDEWREKNNVSSRGRKFDNVDMNIQAEEDEKIRDEMETQLILTKYNDVNKYLAIVSELSSIYDWQQDNSNPYNPPTWKVAADIYCQMEGKYSNALYLSCNDFYKAINENAGWVNSVIEKFREFIPEEESAKKRLHPRFIRWYRDIKNALDKRNISFSDLSKIAYIMSPMMINQLFIKAPEGNNFGDDYLNKSITTTVASYGPADARYTAKYYPANIDDYVTITADIARYYDWTKGNKNGVEFWNRPLYLRDEKTGCSIAVGVDYKRDLENSVAANINAGKKLTITGKVSRKAPGKQFGTLTTWLNGRLKFEWS